MSGEGAARSHVTTHVLDSVTGRPAAGVTAELDQRADTAWVVLATGETDADGRLADLSEHYHVPLQLSPFAYSTFRGS
ncbi:hypothetical protein E3O10_15555 [Cryobacterium luteum]|uniref:Transthyretin/hydroxyisourate hydrolase domain-containing protein n=1 Tax=Cryobacterium luteum TaxID=1424661 RepID=A0A5F0D0I0_9MICO|nr:hypothetical protein E3O10_15555 [Cryobacterium luteum]